MPCANYDLYVSSFWKYSAVKTFDGMSLNIMSIIKAKAEADKRAKMMSDLDDEFGVADIVQDKLKKDQAKRWYLIRVFGSVTFYPADSDLYGTDPFESAIRFNL